MKGAEKLKAKIDEWELILKQQIKLEFLFLLLKVNY
jgi:hypothetical protein